MMFFSLFSVFILIICGISNGIMPLYSRKGTPFGITVPLENQKNSFVLSLKKRFFYWNILGSVLLSLPFFFFLTIKNEESAAMWSSIYLIVALLIYLVASLLLYGYFRKKIKKWKLENNFQTDKKIERTVIDLHYQKELKTISTKLMVAIQLFIVLLTIGVTLLFYRMIPERFPVHWGINMKPDRYAEKNWLSVLSLPMIQLILIPVLTLSQYSFIRAKQKLSPLAPVSSSFKSKKFRQAWSIYFLVVTVLTQLLFSSIHFSSLFSMNEAIHLGIFVILIYVGVLVLYSLFLTFKYGQGGEKLLLLDDEEIKNANVSEVDEEAYWKWGLVYFNKQDPSIFVEKRFGIGSTMNMARWQSWAFVAGIVLIVGLIILLSGIMLGN